MVDRYFRSTDLLSLLLVVLEPALRTFFSLRGLLLDANGKRFANELGRYMLDKVAVNGLQTCAEVAGAIAPSAMELPVVAAVLCEGGVYAVSMTAERKFNVTLTKTASVKLQDSIDKLRELVQKSEERLEGKIAHVQHVLSERIAEFKQIYTPNSLFEDWQKPMDYIDLGHTKI